MKTRKLFYFDTCQNIDELKKQYRNLCKLHHPDKGGDTETMQAVNAEYAYIVENLNTFFYCENETEQKADLSRFASIIEQIEGLPLDIEIIGAWLWVSGNTYPYRVELKTAGLMFAPVKKMWYYRPAEFRSSNFKPLPIEEIRNKYGSFSVQHKTVNQLSY
jgi:hypothetical protein